MKILSVVFILLLSSTLFAQVVPQPDSWTVLVLPATGDPATVAAIAQRVVPVAQALCNQTALPAPPVPLLNPTIVEFDDPGVVPLGSKKCRLPLPNGLPNGTAYRVVVVASTASVPSTRSLVAANSFNVAPVPLVPAVPTGLGVRP